MFCECDVSHVYRRASLALSYLGAGKEVQRRGVILDTSIVILQAQDLRHIFDRERLALQQLPYKELEDLNKGLAYVRPF